MTRPELSAAPATGLESAAAPTGYLLRVWALVAAFGAVTVWRSLTLGIAIRDPGHEYFLGRVVQEAALVALLVVADGGWRSRRVGQPWWSTVRSRWDRSRLILVAQAIVAYQLVYLSYHNLKSWVVFRPLQDDLLVRLDEWLFAGHRPWLLLHDLLGHHVASYFLMVVYESFGTLVMVAFAAALVFPTRVRDSFVYVASAMWVWILGSASYYLLPSTGPFHATPEDFEALPHTVIQSHQALYYAERVYLLAHPHAPDAFARIGAFASLHVGVTALIMVMAWQFGLRRSAAVLAGYLALTMIATVFFGWHYFVDDLAGVLIAVAGVWLGRRTVFPRRLAVGSTTEDQGQG